MLLTLVNRPVTVDTVESKAFVNGKPRSRQYSQPKVNKISFFAYDSWCSNIAISRNLRITKLDLSRGSEGVITDGVVSAICDNLTLLEHLDLSYNIGVSDIGTLGLSDENIKQSLDEMMKQGHKISLASRFEILF